MKTFRINLIVWTLLAIFLTPASVQAETPGQTIIATIDKGMKILRDPELLRDENIGIRRERLWNTLEPVFNFDEVAKRSLGRNWLTLNPEQRNEFTRVFTTVLKDVYLKKSDNYSEGEIVYIREIVKGRRSKVQTNFVNGDKKVVVNFSMKKHGEFWKIYDVIIEGVSILTNYRTQFDSILKKSSFEDLMERLNEREMEISQEN